MGQACCQQGMPKVPVQIIAHDMAEKVCGLREDSDQSNAAAPAAVAQLECPGQEREPREGCAVVGSVPAQARRLSNPSLQRSTPTPQARRSLYMSSGAERQAPPPPPAAAQDTNGSAVMVLRQPNRKRSLRVDPPAKSAVAARRVSGTALQKPEIADLWAALPVVARDVVLELPSSPHRPAGSRKTPTSHAVSRKLLCDQAEELTPTGCDFDIWDDRRLLEEEFERSH